MLLEQLKMQVVYKDRDVDRHAFVIIQDPRQPDHALVTMNFVHD